MAVISSILVFIYICMSWRAMPKDERMIKQQCTLGCYVYTFDGFLDLYSRCRATSLGNEKLQEHSHH